MTRSLIAVLVLTVVSGPLFAQYAPGEQGSRNMKVMFHLPSVGATDIRLEQELSRPYVYQPHGRPAGFHIINVKDPARAATMYSWNIENPELVRGGATGVMLFKHKARYYSILSTQLGRDGPSSDVVGIVFDVTGLPDTTRVKEVARIRNATDLGGSHEAFTYKHSDGRALFITTVSGAPFSDIYDLDKVLAGGDPQNGRIGRVPIPESVTTPGGRPGIYHDFYVGYDPATKQDKFYGAGWQTLGVGWTGYYLVFDISRPEEARLLTSVTGAAGVDYAHTFVPTPDGRYAVAESEHQYQPLKIFDLKPGLDGTVKTISRPIGAWTANWKQLPHQMEMRWPYLFVAGYADGVHVVNMMDPTNPYTVGYYDTFDRPTLETPNPGVVTGGNTNSVYVGNWGVDIRNADGLIVASDSRTGTWGLKMEGFDGWNGRQWGMPNISSAQDWDNGPEGAPKKIS